MVAHSYNPSTREADLCKFQASLVYKESSKTATATKRNLISNKTKQTNKNYFFVCCFLVLRQILLDGSRGWLWTQYLWSSSAGLTRAHCHAHLKLHLTQQVTTNESSLRVKKKKQNLISGMLCRGEKAVKGLKIAEKVCSNSTINIFLKEGYNYSAR